MTRGEQTAWIVGAMALLFFFYTEHQRKSLPKWDYARCEGLFGTDNACRAAVAAYRLSNGATDLSEQ